MAYSPHYLVLPFANLLTVITPSVILIRAHISFLINNSYYFSVPAKPDVTLIIKDSDLVDLMSGKLNSQKAFFQGKLKV